MSKLRGRMKIKPNSRLPNRPGIWRRRGKRVKVFIDDFGHLAFRNEDGAVVWVNEENWSGEPPVPKEGA